MSASENNIVERYQVESQSTAGRLYTVSLLRDGNYACACIGWTRHMPRRDCAHIHWVRLHGPAPIDPMVAALDRVARKAVVA